TKGDSSRECASAWDIVEELLAVASHQRVAKENIQEIIE
ncbi:MAG: CP12 domain-containing protein, partial [Dolichospermum sp.]